MPTERPEPPLGTWRSTIPRAAAGLASACKAGAAVTSLRDWQPARRAGMLEPLRSNRSAALHRAKGHLPFRSGARTGEIADRPAILGTLNIPNIAMDDVFQWP